MDIHSDQPVADPVLRSGGVGGGTSRRSLLIGVGAVGIGTVLAACGLRESDRGSSTSGTPSPAEDRSRADGSVSWSNWSGRLDTDSSLLSFPTLAAFISRTGISVHYTPSIEGNQSYYASIQPRLARGEDIGADLVVLTDWMAEQCLAQGYAQQLDIGIIPNVAANLSTSLADATYDPGRSRSLPWLSGFSGIAWNTKALADLDLDPPRRVSDLWDRKLRGRVEVLDEMRDTTGLIMADQGADVTSFTASQFDAALSALKEQLSNGQIRQVRGQSYVDGLRSGDIVACFAWSGDIHQLNEETGYEGEFTFVLPEAGGLRWTQDLWIPVGSPHKENAEILINYYYDPEVAAVVSEATGYVSPVEGAVGYVSSATAEDPLIFPTGKENAAVFRTLTSEEQSTFAIAFTKAVGG